MTPPFAFVEQLAAWVGQDIPASDARAEAVLMAASVLVRSEVGASVSDAWATVPDDVGLVVVQVAARVWFNPQGLLSDSIDDYDRRFKDELAESGVFLTSAERDILSAYRTKPKGLWSLGVTRGDEYDDQYVDVVNAATPSTLEEPIPFLPPGA